MEIPEMEVLTMYEYLREMLNLADSVKDVGGVINTVDMGNFLTGLDRICIHGERADGIPFELTLEVGKYEPEETTDGDS